MVLSTCFNGYDAGIMTVILADSQFIKYYSVDANRSGIIASIPWAATGAFSYHYSLFARRIEAIEQPTKLSLARRCATLPWGYSRRLLRTSMGAPHINSHHDCWCRSTISTEHVWGPHPRSTIKWPWLRVRLHSNESIW